MATRIGCDNLVVALLSEDTGSVVSWGSVQSLPGVMSLNIGVNSSSETLFYDDGPGEAAAALGKLEVGITKNDLSTAEKALLLGHEIDNVGGLVYGANDTPPWLALGFRTLKSNGKYRYVWLYKGKFQEPDDKNETKGDKINFQSQELTGNFVMLDTVINVVTAAGTKAKKLWKYEMDADSPGATLSVMSGWFSAVVKPSTAAKVDVTGVALDKETAAIVHGSAETLVATISPANATNKAVAWSSSDSGVATVDSNGIVLAIAAGTATITVMALDGTFTDTCAVTVS